MTNEKPLPATDDTKVVADPGDEFDPTPGAGYETDARAKIAADAVDDGTDDTAAWDSLAPDDDDDEDGEGTDETPDEESEPEPESAPAVSYSAATVKSLTELLTAAGLEHTGNKPELYARAAAAGLLNEHRGQPGSYTVGDETHYIQVAAKFNIANYRELGALNGVTNSRYELSRGDVVQLPAPKRG